MGQAGGKMEEVVGGFLRGEEEEMVGGFLRGEAIFTEEGQIASDNERQPHLSITQYGEADLMIPVMLDIFRLAA